MQNVWVCDWRPKERCCYSLWQVNPHNMCNKRYEGKNMEKTCVRCGEPDKEYWTGKTVCVDCLKAYNKKYRSKRKKWCHPDDWKGENGWWICAINYYEQNMKKRNI
tara:strand:+ start:81 stop:398 length:318 start_codon:yes stop_codon:yes gene_type:complete